MRVSVVGPVVGSVESLGGEVSRSVAVTRRSGTSSSALAGASDAVRASVGESVSVAAAAAEVAGVSDAAGRISVKESEPGQSLPP